MNKTYTKPQLTVEAFDVDDVITASAANPVAVISNLFEQVVNMLSAPWQ